METETLNVLDKIITIIKAQSLAEIYYHYHSQFAKGIPKAGKRSPGFEGFLELLGPEKNLFEEKFGLFLLTQKEVKIIRDFGLSSKENKELYREAIEVYFKQSFANAKEKYLKLLDKSSRAEDDALAKLGFKSDLASKIKLIMSDDVEYPYKSDKIKGLFALNLSEMDIVQVTQTTKFACNTSYVRQIMQQEREKKYPHLKEIKR